MLPKLMYILTQPEEIMNISRIRPEYGKVATPLAVTHMVGGKVNKRYDYIDVEYRYEEAIRHGWNHAVVVAELKQKKIIK